MIVIIAGNYNEARTWARGQLLDDDEWTFPMDEYALLNMTNFHTIIVGNAGHNVPASYFERILSIAKERGRIGRK